jgi:hypothetical protein
MSTIMGRLVQFARSTQAVPQGDGTLFVGGGCGISTMCAGTPSPPQSIMAGVTDFRLGM